MCSGGPGPEIAIAIDRFPTGTTVSLTVTVTSGGGQSATSTRIVTVQGEVDHDSNDSLKHAML